MMSFILILLVAYVLGSISPSILISKMVKGIDVRTTGSGNAGMTNAMRLLGAKWGTLVALIDVTKGFVAAMVVTKLLGTEIEMDPVLLRILAGSAAVAGHIWTIFHGFKGGKGVLTLSGAVLGVAPIPIGICLLIFFAVFGISRYVSLGSIIGSICLPVIILVQKYFFGLDVSPYLLGFSFFVTLLIIYTHRANIGRLMRGEEKKVGTKKVETPAP